eukprot:Nk52_evm5s250 gene=Nk52_evmTU5s250
MSFGIQVEALCSLMEVHSEESAAKLTNEYGGPDGVCRLLNSDMKQGIPNTGSEYETRKAAFGENYIPPPRAKTYWELCYLALQDYTLIMLLLSATISIALGVAIEDPSTGWIEGVAILISVTVVVNVSAINDYQKEAQFRKLNAVKDDILINVVRDGQHIQVSTYKLVCGDIVELSVGDILATDGLVLDSNDLKINESSLTGESDDIKKSKDGNPFVYSGTKVMEGVGVIVVTGVGPNSQQGIITTLISGQKAAKSKPSGNQVSPDGPDDSDANPKDTGAVEAEEASGDGEIGGSVLQAKLEKLALDIGKGGTVIAVVCVLVMTIRFLIEKLGIDKTGWESGYFGDLLSFFIVGITILVVAVPEGLPLAVTLSLAFSVKKMMRDNNLVRHLDACETMGSATTICSDKTGTLTTNRMTVVSALVGGKPFDDDAPSKGDLSAHLEELLGESIAINSTARVEKHGDQPIEHIGNKTECALLTMIYNMGIDFDTIRENNHPEKLYTFSSARKRMSVLVKKPDGSFRLYTKGASEIILDLCTTELDANGSAIPLNQAKKDDYAENTINKYASNGLRTLSLAYRDFASPQNWEDGDEVEKDLTLISIVGIEDPVRPEVPGAIKVCQKAGITVRMVTGDNIVTARSIAGKCGILGPNSQAMEGPDFRKRCVDENGDIKQDEFDKIWPTLHVLARSSPTDKYILVSGLIQSTLFPGQGQVVAVTGDGTNDGPALKRADVGFAMGIAGTSVAKDASDIILLDDNFKSIVQAVKWGRNVYDSIAKFLQFQLTVNIVSLSVAFIGAVVLSESPLRAVQMLWVNLIMDSFASLALATEPPTDDLLDRQPYGRDRPLLSNIMLRNMIGQSIFQLAILLVLVFNGEEIFDIPSGREKEHDEDPTQHYTIVFNTFVYLTIFNEINSRKVNSEINVFDGMFDNMLFVYLWLGTAGAQVLLVEFGGTAFKTEGLTAEQWTACILIGMLALPFGFINRLVPPDFFPNLFKKEPAPEEIGRPSMFQRGASRIIHQHELKDEFGSGHLTGSRERLNAKRRASVGSAGSAGQVTVDIVENTPVEYIDKKGEDV